MKKSIGILGCGLLVLCSCGTSQALEFPKTSWDMTPDKVLEAYQVKQEDTSFYEEQGRNAAFVLENQEIFRETAQTVMFSFMNMELRDGEDIQTFDEGKEEGEKVLYGVTVIYPQDADMDKVEENMEKLYGERPLSELSVFSAFDVLGTGELNETEYTETDERRLWGSETIEKVMDREKSAELQEKWASYLPGLQEEQWKDFSKKGRLVTTILEKDGDTPFVKFDGYNQVVYQAIMNEN